MKTVVLNATAPLGVLAFWGGILLAAQNFPSEYDWRYMTLSSLLSPSRDPSGHLWASGGILLSAICGFCWAAVLVRNSKSQGRANGVWFLWLGNLFMICSGVLPSSLLPMQKGHEIFVLLAFVGLSVGMVIVTFQTVESNLQSKSERYSRRTRSYAALLALGAVFPILVAGCTEAYVFYGRPELHWVGLAWRAQRVPVYLSFAFWEWVTCIVLSVYIITLPLLGIRAARRMRDIP